MPIEPGTKGIYYDSPLSTCRPVPLPAHGLYTPAAIDLATADFGRTPNNYEKQIRDRFELTLIDPRSAHYQMGRPYEAPIYKGIIWGGGY